MYGDHWSEPARCHRCGQERSTHDDGFCEVTLRVFSMPAKPIRLNNSLDDKPKEQNKNGWMYCRACKMSKPHRRWVGRIRDFLECLECGFSYFESREVA